MAAAFSTPDTAVLERSVDEDDPAVELEQIWSEAQQKICVGWIRHNGYKRICLQFPDNYLPLSSGISDSLKALILNNGRAMADTRVFIMADTSYGSCCVDEVAAEHVRADCIIHFGNACRSKVSRLPVLYVYPQLSFDLTRFLQQLLTLQDACRDKDVCVYLDIGYQQLLECRSEEGVEASLSGKLREVLPCKELHIEAYPASEDNQSDYEDTAERVCIFVGADNRRFFNVSLTTKAAQWYIYDGATQSLYAKNPLTANYIRRRYYYIEKCKDAQVLGLLVATLSADGYLDVVTRLKEMAHSRGMKTQLISVGRINPAKLANFLEIDCFVLIGCAFNNLHNEKDFYKPIVSVFEAEMALNPAWHMRYPEAYVSDFKQLLPEGRSFLPFVEGDVLPPDVSLVSGRLRNAGAADSSPELSAALSEQQRALLVNGNMQLLGHGSTGRTFEDRSWQGLEPALGCNEPAALQPGLSGIPTNYTHN